jgi:transcriptional regulator with XRE-family HTH domain
MTLNFSRALRLCRAAFGLSQAAFAARMGISASYLSLIEAGKRRPPEALLSALSDEMQLPRHLVLLLASEPRDVRETSHDELAKALLALLAAAEKQQRPLPFQ